MTRNSWNGDEKNTHRSVNNGREAQVYQPTGGWLLTETAETFMPDLTHLLHGSVFCEILRPLAPWPPLCRYSLMYLNALIYTASELSKRLFLKPPKDKRQAAQGKGCKSAGSIYTAGNRPKKHPLGRLAEGGRSWSLPALAFWDAGGRLFCQHFQPLALRGKRWKEKRT